MSLDLPPSRARAERLLRRLAESAHSDPTVILSPLRDGEGRLHDLRYEMVNRPAAEWIGVPAGLLVGRTMRQVLAGDDAETLLPRLLRVSETGEVWADADHLAADGARRYSLRAVADLGHVALTFREVPPAAAGPEASHAELETVRRVAAAIGAGLSRDDVFAILSRDLEHLYGAGSVNLGRAGAGAVDVVASTLEPRPFYLPGDMPLAAVLRTGRTARCDDLASLEDPLAREYVARGLRAGVAAPVRAGRHQWGGIAIACPEPPGPGAERTLEAVGTVLGILLRDVEARRRDPGRRTFDRLTGLPDHPSFRDRLADEWERALLEGAPLALAILDIDHFAEVNARHGPATGDAVLVEVAARLRAVAGPAAPLFRIGGEEFAWILPGLDSAGALAAGARARRAIGAEGFPGVGDVTLSGGVADIGQAGRPTELLRLAEGALSWAKTHGRDLLLAYDPEVVAALSPAEWAERLERDATLVSIEALARTVDAKDRTTREHSDRVAQAAEALAVAVGWPEWRARLLAQAARVHDVGKVGVPDEILTKAGALTERELARMRAHAERGAEIVAGVLTPEQALWIRHHHERWDGRGYPDGLVAEAIPEGARIIAVVDALDTMLSDRPYRAARTPEEAMAELLDVAGSQLWPEGVAAAAALRAGGVRRPPPRDDRRPGVDPSDSVQG